ncbi:MAG: SMI1/KNR4 family protein, partial [bacterium]|nr:SMI1/KNR4 family protein [bacterium]
MKYQQQIEGIKKKLLSAKKNDKRLKVFGASSHKYKLKKPASEDMLLSFEKEYSIVLPECYRAFLSSIGNGGISYANSAAGPFYGIYPLGRCGDELVETPNQYLKMPVRIEPNMT